MNKLGRVQETILEQMFKHYVTLKMYHFQTKHFGAHQASDKYLASFLGHFDQFLEVYQGIFKTVTSKSLKIEAQMVTDQDIAGYLDGFCDFLTNLDKLLGKGTFYDLYAIRDEMIGEVNRFKYLLRFQ